MKKLIALIICIAILLTSCGFTGNKENPVSRDGLFFDTIITITIYDKSTKEAENILDDCFELSTHYDKLFSKTDESSDISRINSAAPEFVTVDPDTVELIQKSLEFCTLTDVFDITMGNLTSMWDFEEEILPDFEELAYEAQFVDFNKVEIQGEQVRLTEPNVSLDLGAIAKGYISEKIKAYLLSQNVTSAIINLGGNVEVIGGHLDGSPFKVAIADPFSETGDYSFILPATDKTIVTSGNYQRFFEKDGVYYHHILDKTTGMPVNNDVASVTIIGDNSADCDALSTISFILGSESGLSFIEGLEGFEAIYILQSGEILKTTGAGDIKT